MTISDQSANRACSHCLELLDAFLDNALDSIEQSRLAMHLVDCAACAAEVQLRRLVRLGLQSLPRRAATEQAYAAILDAIQPLHCRSIRISRRTEQYSHKIIRSQRIAREEQTGLDLSQRGKLATPQGEATHRIVTRSRKQYRVNGTILHREIQRL